MLYYSGRNNHHHHPLNCGFEFCKRVWMTYQDPWVPAQDSLSGSVRPFSHLLLFSSCRSVVNSTPIPPSVANSKIWGFTSFLVTIMGLVIPWSFTLALLDGYSVLVTRPVRQKGILFIIVIGDWMLLTLTLAAASSAAAVVDILLKADGSVCPPKVCSRYLLSTIFAFLSWFLSMASSLFNLWLLPSL